MNSLGFRVYGSCEISASEVGGFSLQSGAWAFSSGASNVGFFPLDGLSLRCPSSGVEGLEFRFAP